MPTLILTTPTTPGSAAWTDSTLVPTAPGGAAGGDLSGTYPNPTVDGLQGRPVSAAIPAIGNTLTWNGITWAPAAPGTTVFSLVSSTNFATGEIVSVNASGQAQLADPSLAFTPRRYDAIGIAQASVVAPAPVSLLTDVVSSVPVRFAAIPPFAANGSRVYLSTTPGRATLTPPPAGNATFFLGILVGADGNTPIPAVLINFQLIAEIP